MAENLLKSTVEALLEKKVVNPVILNLKKFQTFTDYFIIASGTSNKHVQALADSVKECNKKNKFPLLGEEGYQEAKWVLLDYGELIVHIFDENVREFYDIEGLWLEAEKIDTESLISDSKA